MDITTIKVKPWTSEQGDFVVINEQDFDPEVHTLYDPASTKSLTVPQIRELLTAKGVDIPSGNVTKAELLALLDKANAPASSTSTETQ